MPKPHAATTLCFGWADLAASTSGTAASAVATQGGLDLNAGERPFALCPPTMTVSSADMYIQKPVCKPNLVERSASTDVVNVLSDVSCEQ